MNSPLAIVNPNAGSGRCGRRAPGVIAALRDAGVPIEVVETKKPGDATEIARREWAAGRRTFISVGGDGTTFEIVNGLFPEAEGSEQRPVLGFLPLGTGNSFLRDFTDDGARYAIEHIRDRKTRLTDVIRATHAGGTIWYNNLLSIGFTADVGALVNRSLKGFGSAGYAMGVLWEVARLSPRPIPFAPDDGEMDASPLVFVSFNNSKFTGGSMRIAPGADCSDGLIEVVIVRDMGRFTLLRTFPKIFDGTHVNHRQVDTLKARTVHLALDGPVDVMVDGEVIRLHLRRLDALHHAIEVMA